MKVLVLCLVLVFASGCSKKDMREDAYHTACIRLYQVDPGMKMPDYSPTDNTDLGLSEITDKDTLILVRMNIKNADGKKGIAALWLERKKGEDTWVNKIEPVVTYED